MEPQHANSSIARAPQESVFRPDREDPLAHLPCSTISAFRKDNGIYEQGQLADTLYLVIAGRVKLFRLLPDGRHVVTAVYSVNDFFGEAAFLANPVHAEFCVALGSVKLMTWTTATVEELLERRPKFVLALTQLMVQRSLDLTQRIESFSVDGIGRRLAGALLTFSGRLGTPAEDGWVEMVPFTHELLAQYVGTSREIVTHHMNLFRRENYLRYSRKGIVLNGKSLNDWMRHKSPRKSRLDSSDGSSQHFEDDSSTT